MNTVTANQAEMLKKIALSCYNGYNGNEPESISHIPMHDVVKTNADKGTITSLKNAELVVFKMCKDINSNYCHLTEKGFAVYKSLGGAK